MKTPIDDYLANVSEPALTTLQKVRERIHAALPKGEGVETISYQVATIKHPPTKSAIGFAAFPEHCSLFVFSGTLLDAFKDELQGYETSKGTIRFPLNKPLPAALIRKLVLARMGRR